MGFFSNAVVQTHMYDAKLLGLQRSVVWHDAAYDSAECLTIDCLRSFCLVKGLRPPGPPRYGLNDRS